VKNPCAEKPKPIRKAGIKDSAKLMEMGNKLWNDKKLGTSGAACATCHAEGKGLKKAPFPKYIKMADDMLTLDQMINFCLLNPMKGKPLPWNSVEITALAAYAQANAKEEGGAANPCAVKNPCAAKNPCAMKNPCGKKK
jgi:cytochrome c